MNTAPRPTPDTHTTPDLPAGWRWVKLEEVIIEARSGFACGERDPNGVIQLRMNNVDTRGNFIWNEFIRVPATGETIAQYQLESEDVLFNNTNSTELVGKSALFEGHQEPVVYSNHFTRLRTNKSLLTPMFLAAWLNHQWTQGVFADICNRWIGQSAVKANKLLTLEIPLPPLPEQQRIAVILNAQMAAVERARAAAEDRLAAIRALPAACLRQVFPQPDLELSEGWRWVRVEQICDIRLGKMLSPASKQGIRPVPYLRNANVQWNRFDLTDIAEMDFTEEQEETLALKPGDLIVCEGGEPGRSAVWQGDLSRCCYQKALHRLRPMNGEFDSYFMMFWLWYGALRGEFTESHAKTTIAHLPAIRLKKLRIAIPSLSKQQHITSFLNEQMTAIERARAAAEAELAAINALPAALLRRAFAGEN